MICELNKADYEKVRPLFLALEHQLMSVAVLDGSRPGKVLADNPDNPQTAFLFSPRFWGYLAGNPDNDAFNRALNKAIFAREIFSEGVSALFLTCHPEDWHGQLAVVCDPRQAVPMPRLHYVCCELKYDWRADVPDGFTVHRIDDVLLKQPRLKIPDDVYNWMKEWGSIADFLERGLGFVTIHDDEVVCWAMADCICGDATEMGIHTADGFRRRGLATITTAAMVEYALSQGLSEIGWHCAAYNIGSIRTAERVGFEKERDYLMHSFAFDEVSNLAQLAYYNLLEGYYQRTIDVYERFFALRDDPPSWSYYDVARAWAGLGNRDKAFEYLNAATDRGWADIDGTKECREFENLHSTPEWEAVLERMQQNLEQG